MTETNNDRGPSLVGIIVSVVLGTGGATFAVGGTSLGQSIFRPDPATGTQVQRLESRIDQHLNRHPDQTGAFDARLREHTTRMDYLEKELERLRNDVERVRNNQ